MNYNLLISELFLTPYLFKFTHGHTKAFGEFILEKSNREKEKYIEYQQKLHNNRMNDIKENK